MSNLNKTQLVTEWGFKAQLFGNSFYRDIYAADGYIEIWSPANPDLIKFYKAGDLSHEYVIDWSLFN